MPSAESHSLPTIAPGSEPERVNDRSPRRVTVRLAADLRRLANNCRLVEVDITRDQAGTITVGAVLTALAVAHPGIHHAALNECGEVRQHVNVFAGTENIRHCAGLATVLPDGAELWILPAVSGGASG